MSNELFPEYGDRPDIQLARDISEGVKSDNYCANLNRSIESPSWGGADCRYFSEMILNLIEEGKSSILFDFTGINSDMNLHEAVNNACIILGLDEDDFCPSIIFDGAEAEVRLY